MNQFKELVRSTIRRAGYDLVRYKRRHRGVNRFLDVKFFLGETSNPMVIDVGANVGQTILRVKSELPGATIHSFEPGASAFATLRENHQKMNWPNVSIWNHGIGSADGSLTFQETEKSVMSSFLTPGVLAGTGVAQSYTVAVKTLDTFVDEQQIPYVHLLKSDTQGFELEVFKGARRLFSEQRVGMILCECIVAPQYRNLPPFDELLGFLRDHGFKIAGLYDLRYQRNLLGWLDILVVSESMYERRTRSAV